jgi:hypothetical protein
MFRTVPLSIIRSFHCTQQQWYMSYRFADSLRAGSGWNCSFILIQLASYQQTCMTYDCCVYSKKITPDDGKRNCPKHVEFPSKNKFEKIVHLVGFIITPPPPHLNHALMAKPRLDKRRRPSNRRRLNIGLRLRLTKAGIHIEISPTFWGFPLLELRCVY